MAERTKTLVAIVLRQCGYEGAAKLSICKGTCNLFRFAARVSNRDYKSKAAADAAALIDFGLKRIDSGNGFSLHECNEKLRTVQTRAKLVRGKVRLFFTNSRR